MGPRWRASARFDSLHNSKSTLSTLYAAAAAVYVARVRTRHRNFLLGLLALVHLLALAVGPFAHATTVAAAAVSAASMSEDCAGHGKHSVAAAAQESAPAGSPHDCCHATDCHGTCTAAWLLPAANCDLTFACAEPLPPLALALNFVARSGEVFRPPIV